MKIILLILMLMLGGCASVPSCENPRYQMVVSEEGQPLAVFDLDGMTQLIRTITGLSKGTCRLPVPE